MKTTYRCRFVGIYQTGAQHIGLVCERLQDHDRLGPPRKDKITHTSDIVSIDFERGICVTQNSIYIFEGRKK